MTHSTTVSTGKKLHIVIISQNFPPSSYGGVGVYYQNLLKELLQLGYFVTVICRGEEDETITVGPYTQIIVGPDDSTPIWPECPTISKNVTLGVQTALLIEQIHRERPIDVIESALCDFEGIGALHIRSSLKIPLVVRLVKPILVATEANSRDMTADIELCAHLERHIIEHADAVIPVSESIKKTFSERYDIVPDSRWTIQLAGIQPWPSFTNLTNYNEFPKDLTRGDVQILFIGRLESRKGIDVFLKALAIALPSDTRISVWIAGIDMEGWQKKAPGIHDEQFSDRVQFLGVVDDSRKELLYAHSDFVVLPSRYESFGLVALESMVHGTPVIGVRTGAIPEVVLDGFCGLLFNADDDQDLALKILLLAGDEPLRKELAVNAKVRVGQLSARDMAEKSSDIYRALTTSQHH